MFANSSFAGLGGVSLPAMPWPTPGILSTDLLHSVFLLAVLVALRTSLGWALQRRSIETEDRRRLLVAGRNLLMFAGIAGIVVIWLPEVRSLGVYLLAVAAAVVIAIKELLLCLMGTIVRVSSQAYRIGDRIELHGFRGEVVDSSLLTTSLMEVGESHQYTGRSVTLPNSTLLSHPVVNESHLGEYGVHVLGLPLKEDAYWPSHEAALLEAAQVICKPWLDSADKHMRKLAGKHALDMPSAAPRVRLSVMDDGRMRLVLRYPAPANERVRAEQAILRGYLERMG